MSSCSDEEFLCTSGECISAALRCDFKKDCENGSDEEFCGICIYILGSIFNMSNFEPLLLKCLSEFFLKAHAHLRITPVAGTTPVMRPTTGRGKWQTSPHDLV